MKRQLLVLGTRNRKKVEELRPLLASLPLDLALAADFPKAPEIEEDGGSFLANASKKASGVARACGHWTLAEDSGLAVPALGGEPGVDSAHYAGKHGADEANNEKLLEKLADVPEERRAAYYICVAALANPRGDVVATSEGRCHGRIVSARRGSGGFGYDPLFLVPEFHRTFGELSPLVKEAISHRSRAIAALRPALVRHLFPASTE